MSNSDIKKEAKKLGVNSLFSSPAANPKVAKNLKIGVLTYPLHLSPANESGFNVCQFAGQCKNLCLHTAGNPAYLVAKIKARKARTLLFFLHRKIFMDLLKIEINGAIAKAKKLKMNLAFRLNATSDLPWEKIKISDNETVVNYITKRGATAYDYTKDPRRFTLDNANYHLTFSLAENNKTKALELLDKNYNIAVVFNTKKNKPLPDYFLNRKVIDGDLSDYRPNDPAGIIVGLRAKGKAINSNSEFVVSV
jgi:hypothetical protein